MFCRWYKGNVLFCFGFVRVIYVVTVARSLITISGVVTVARVVVAAVGPLLPLQDLPLKSHEFCYALKDGIKIV